MAQEWYANCKDCGKEFGYSDASYHVSARRGMSRPERCPACRQLHTREISTLGLSHFELSPVHPIPASGLQPGRLGGLIRPERIHQPKEQKSTHDFNKFGIKDQHIREYFELIQKHQVTVIVAPTGAGKSTFLPYRLMIPPEPLPQDLWTRNGQIVITQPRIQATRNIPVFVAQALHGSTLGAGFDVGFRHSGNSATDWRNKMVYMTDGTLINMIVRNEIGRLSVIMIDEAHERSLNIDLILGLLKRHLPRYPHLKLIVASATIDTDLFINYYGGRDKVGFYEFPGERPYPVESRFRENEPIPENQFSGHMPEEVAKKVFEVLLAMETNNNPDLITMKVNGKPTIVKGDILAFLQGEKPIDRAVTLIQEMVEDEPALAGKVDVLPLYTKLSQSKQDLALKPKKDKNRWRVVISTNVAETSLTVEGIVHVVETGLINESQWDPESQTSFVTPKIHSQAGCKQRWGRAGRVQPGIAHCLYTEEQFKNFPPHTLPEIVRAPLDQIVLTAKAAGVDSIKEFDWIQRPPEAELERAPYYLSQMRALDGDGDLTEHGLELRSFAAETDVANLMILADHFGCAVEMATLIPMLKLGGYTKLLLWDRSWDAPTKRAVHRIQQGLIKPCLDDVEFYLKLWELWEGSRFRRETNEQRLRWSQQFFINHQLFLKQIVPERESLISSLSAHTKDDKARPIDFDLLTRLRIVLTYGLSTQIYQLANRPMAGQEMEDAPIYKPYIPNPEANPELQKLHEGVAVEISPESICFGRQLPDYFVCGKRQRVVRRLSPQAEPVTIISAAFITLISPEWLQLIGKPPIAIARYMATSTRQADGRLIPTTTQARLFVDQDYPIGARYACQMSEDGQKVEIGRQEKYAPFLRIGSSFEEVDTPDEIEVLESEGELDKTAGLGEKTVHVSVTPNAEEEPPTWLDMLEEEDEPQTTPYFQQSEQKNLQEIFTGRVVYTASPITPNTPFSSIVVGYDFSDRYHPIIQLETPTEPSPFQLFRQQYQPGNDVTVELVSVEQYVNDWLLYLVVREVKTGLEIVLDPYDASLIGRNFAIDYLRQFSQGTQFSVTIEEIDNKGNRVRATRLRAAEATMLQLMGKQKERTVEAVIVEVRENGLYLWLDPEQTQGYMPNGAFAHIKCLPQRPDQMSIEKTCRAIIKFKQWQKPLRRALTSLPDDLIDKLKQQRLGNNLEWDEQNHTLIAKGRISYDQRRKLLELSEDGEFRRAINILFRRSNELDVIKVIDDIGLKTLQLYQLENKPAPGKVISISDQSIEIDVDGFRTRIPKREITYDPTVDLREKYELGKAIEVHVKEVNTERGDAQLSLLRPEDDPLNQYQPAQVLHGDIVSTTDFGAFVELTPGVQGLVHISELAWWRVERTTDIVHRGQRVKVQILDINREERRLELTMRFPENDPLCNFQVNQRVQGKVVGYTNDNTGAFVELTPGVEGFLYKDEIHVERVDNARQALSEGQQVQVRITELDRNERKLRLTIRGLYEEGLWVPESHKRIVIGKGGTSIKNIQRDTKTYINLDDNGYCLIQGMSQIAVNHARQTVQTILATKIVTFSIQPRQIPMLIGKGGDTIKGIESSDAQINVDSSAGRITVTAANDIILRRTLEQIQAVISYYEVVIQVPSHMIGRVVGTRGATIDSIRNQTGVEIDIARDSSGHITIKGKNSDQVGRAVALIQSKTGSVNYLSVNEGTLPVYTEVRSPTPTKQRTHPTTTQPVISSQPVAPPPLPKPQPAKTAISPRPTITPQIHQQELRVTASQMASLIRKPGGYLGQSLVCSVAASHL